jgi:hypothetical protein
MATSNVICICLDSSPSPKHSLKSPPSSKSSPEVITIDFESPSSSKYQTRSLELHRSPLIDLSQTAPSKAIEDIDDAFIELHRGFNKLRRIVATIKMIPESSDWGVKDVESLIGTACE